MQGALPSWQLTRNRAQGPGAVQGGALVTPRVALAVTGAQDGQTGVPEVQGPPGSNGVCCPESSRLPGILGQVGQLLLQGKQGLWEMNLKGTSCV